MRSVGADRRFLSLAMVLLRRAVLRGFAGFLASVGQTRVDAVAREDRVFIFCVVSAPVGVHVSFCALLYSLVC